MGPFNRASAVAAAAALLVGFGGGWLVAKAPAPTPAAGGKPAQTGFAWPFFGKIRDANAPRATPAKPAGFAVWTTRVDTTGPEPLACVRMTRPLDGSISYSDFVQITPELDRPPAVNARGDELCVGGGGFYGHRVTLLKGLKARTGETLAANADVDFTFGEQPPYVGFSGQGVILPREEADGLGIETVNVQRLAIEVVRVPDRNLVRKQIAAPDPTPEGDYNYEYGEDAAGEDGRVVWKGEVAVAPQQGARRMVTVFPLGAVLKEMRAGAYVVRAKDASGARAVKAKGQSDDGNPAQARRWILFTDMALMAYSGSDSLDVVVRSLKSAKTLSGVKVSLVAKDGEDLASATTDGSGRVRFAKALLKGEDGSKPRMLMAYGPNADFAALDLDRSPVDLSNQGVGGRSVTAEAGIDAYLYADRGVYRPGETVHLVGLIRDNETKAVKDRKGALVVRRPSGVEYQRIAFDKAANGAVARDVAIPAGAPRGRWRAAIEIEGVEEPVGELSFGVEDFVPQRLAVTAVGDASRALGPGEVRNVDILARFLYGADGAGLDVQGEARIRPDPNPFPALAGYRWGDEQNLYQEKFVELAQTVTDGSGRAVQAFDSSQAGDTAAPLAAAVTASVFEPGGRPVREGLTLKLRTKPLYLGVKTASTGSGDAPTTTFDIVAVSAAGQRIAASKVAYSLISENWDYDWFQKDGRWEWRRTSRDAVIMRGTVNVGTAAPARLSRRLPWGDYRLVLEEPTTGARTVIRLASGWGEPAAGAEPPDSARVSAGTKAYAQGDTVEVTIQAPYAGEAQVAVATDRLIDFRTVSVPKGCTTVKLKTSAAWGGGAYVLVSVIQPRDPAATPKPRRALGLVYVPLDPKSRKLTVTLGTPAKLNSKAPIVVPVTVQGLGLGGKAYVTVAAVDEGILRLTRQESPDPAKWYFGKRALSLDYRDDYGRLLDPNLGAASKVAFGGDEIGGEGLTVTPFKTVALWSGVVQTGAGGKAEVRLPAADFNGELRLMAVAWTDEAVGAGQASMTVRLPVVAELATPRFLSPGDRAFATLELHNLEGRAGAYVAEIFGSGGIAAPFRKLYQLMVGQRVVERTPLNAPASAGIGRVDLKVSGPGFNATSNYPLQTRLGWGPLIRTTTTLQGPGQSFTPAPALLSGLAAGTVNMTVSYSPFRGFDPGPIAESLSRYPYGCTEQLVSGAYPLLYAQALSADPKLRVIPTALNGTVSRLLDRQGVDGAFGLWRPGDAEADAWMGAYTTDFLVEARARGAAVPADAMTRAIAAMRMISRPSGFASVNYRLEYPQTWAATPQASAAATARMRSRASAYALYVLAKAKQGDLARLRWFHDVQMKDEPSPLARAHVGAGLALMGDRARAHDSFVQASRALGFKDEQDWYQSPLRDLAGVIALAYEAGELGVARELQGRLEGSVRDVDSLNTQEQARLLAAADAMLKAAGAMRIQATGARPLSGTRWAVGQLASARFVNGGTGGLWRTVTVRGVSQSAPGAAANGINVDKRLFTLSGGAVDPGALTQGARVVIRLSGTSSQGRSMMTVIDDALPAGFEVETVLGPEDAQKGPFRFLGQLSATQVQEARDDRYVAALTVEGRKGYAVAYVARAVTPGEFFFPGAEVRDMYRPAVNARSAPGRTKIAAGS
ncbi:MAG: alpha-2-macroglobulin [Caulobacterales bacterium 32-69-10]|nr:MAG: alpha-2-macroglobulin [Caulobacterales bacterium 32-69-10]